MTGGGRPREVGVMALAHFTNDANAYIIPALLPLLLLRLEVGLGAGVVLVSLYQVSSSFTQPVLGHLADRGGRTRWMAWCGVALSGLAAGALGLAPSFAFVAAACVAGGIGTALYHPVSAALVAASVPQRSRARWMSAYISAGNFGLPVGTVLLALILRTIGFEGIWLIALPGLALATLVWRFGPHDLRRQPDRPPLATILRANRRMLAGLVSVAATRSWASALLSSFLPVYAVSRGLAAVDAPQILTVFLLSGAIGGLVGGWLADRVGRDTVIIGSMLVAAPVCVLLGLQESVNPVFLATAAASGMLLNGSFVVLAVRGQESMPGSLGMVSGLMLGLSIGLGGFAVAPMGVVAERVGIPVVLYAAAGLSLATAALMRAVPHPPAPAESIAAVTAAG